MAEQKTDLQEQMIEADGIDQVLIISTKMDILDRQ